MLNRILVGLIGIPILIYILTNGGIFLLLFVNFVIGAGLIEFYKMAEIGGKKPDLELGFLAGMAIPNILFFTEVDNSILAVMPITILTIILIGKKVLQNKVENSSRDIGVTLLGVVYVSFLFSHLILLDLVSDKKWLLSIQILVWLCDSFAYFTGIAIGRKFFKQGFSVISPKKSIEGSIGGILATIIGMFVLNNQFELFSEGTSSIVIILFGLLISLVAQIGDLGESMFKREFKVKDSGKILGEHGGILDRFDSMLFVVPIVYYLLKFI